jgi:AmmeMemoRadiSam system protein A
MPETPRLTPEEGRELLRIARATLEHRLMGKPAVRPSPDALTPNLKQNGSAFVTLTKGDKLRGCIGSLAWDRPLYQVVGDCALSAALKDPRFSPVRGEELKDIHLEVSVLTPPVPIRGPDDIVIGRDGLIVEKGWNRGLLLPQVATEWGFDALAFLEATCEKAGLPPDAWPGARLERFEAQIFGE